MDENQNEFFEDRGFPTDSQGILTPPTGGDLQLPNLPTPQPTDPIIKQDNKIVQRQLDFMKKSIKQKALKLSAYDKDLISKNAVQSVLGSFKDNRVNLVDYEVELDEVYKRLNNGTYVPKFENYISGTNNEERLAATQSGWEQALNGVGKGIAKTGLNILDGTVGTVVGLVNGISEGSFSAVYNNGFSQWIDDLNTQMDFALPNYYTQEEKNMGFLRSLGTTNFWANDFTGGMSFMLGTLGSEAIWALATGGASLTVAAPKLALKFGAKGLAKTIGKQSAKNFYKSSLKMMKAYNRTIPVSTAGKAFNNARFLYTSAGYEAGVEARHSLNESLENFVASYEKVHGRKPNAEEYSEFMDSAVVNSNKVFASNVALVGASNIAQFGSYFGLGTGLSKQMTKAFGRTFGLGITKTLDDSGKIIYEALKPNRFQRIAGNTLSVLKAPVVEGFVEEGGQSVISKTSQKWLASRFNPDALRENYDVIDAATSAFQETYGTKEGFKEIGLGMLIGFVGSAGKRGATGGRTPFGVGAFGSQVAANEKLSQDLNEVSSKFTDAQKSMVERLVMTNQFNTYINKSKQEADKGNMFQSSVDWDTAQYTKMLIEDRADMLDESVADFERVINNTPNTSFEQDYGLNQEQISAYREATISNYKDNVETFKKAKQIAEAVAPTSGNININKKDYSQELALNIYLGVKASQRASDVADSIDEMIGTQGIASALRLYTNLSKRAQRRAERIVKLEQDLNTLEAEYATLQNSFTSTNQDKKVRVDENQEVAQEIDKNEVKKAKIFKELQTKRGQLEELEGQLESRFYKSKFSFGGNLNVFKGFETDEALITDEDLKTSVSELSKLDKYREILRQENPKVADSLDLLLEEYIKNVKAFRDFNLVYEQMADPRFARNTYKGLSKLFNNVGVQFNDKDLEESALDVKTQEFEAFMKSNENNLSEDEKFTLRTLDRMSTAFYLNVKIGDYTSNVEPISNEEYDEFINNGEVTETILNSIANKVVDNSDLSQREQDIYDGKRDIIDGLSEEIKLQKGDELTDVVTPETTQEFDTSTLVGRLKNIVENVKRSKRYLNNFDINNFNQEDIPSNKDYEEFDKLFKLQNKSGLTPKKQQRFNQLKQKINDWGKLEGTLTPDKVLMSDLLEQIALIETQLDQKENVLPSMTDLNDLVDIKDFRPTNRNDNYDNLQSYDKAMVSRNSFGDYAISNINISGLLNIIAQDLNIEVQKNKRNLTKPTKGWNIKDVQSGQRFVVQFDNNGQSEKLVIKIGSGNNLVLSEVSKNKLNAFTSLKVYPTNNLPTNYQPLLREVIVGQDTMLIPVDTNFTFEGESQMSVDPIFNLREDDLVYLEVSTKDPYNKKLLDKYNNASKEEKSKIKVELEHSMVIYLKDKTNNLVGVHKSTIDGVTVPNDNKYGMLQKIRKVAVQRVLDENFIENQTIDLGMSLPVSQVYYGHPNFNISKVGDKVFVENTEFSKEALDKVKDIGYAFNGRVYLKNKTKNIESYPFLTNILRSKRYKGRKVPIVAFDFKGHTIAYPVSLKAIDTDVSARLDEIVNNDLSIQDKILALNNLLIQYDIDVDKNGFTFDNFNQGQLVKVKELLKQSRDYPDVSKWLSSESSIDEILTEQATININIANKPFHSPKIRTKITEVNGLQTDALFDLGVSEEISEEVEQEVNKIKEEPC